MLYTWDGIRNRHIEDARGGSVVSEVKTYKLSPEELERYRKGEAKIKVEKQELSKEKYLALKVEGKTDTQIANEFGLHPQEMTSLKKNWGLSGYRVKREEQDKPTEERVNIVVDQGDPKAENHRVAELESQIEKLKKEIEEKESSIQKLYTMNTELTKERNEYKRKYEVTKEALKVHL